MADRSGNHVRPASNVSLTRTRTVLICVLMSLAMLAGCDYREGATFSGRPLDQESSLELAWQDRLQRPQGILLILIDALRADHVGAYGSRRNLTPNLDAIARRSYVFENAWATSSWTRPSVASLFTSRYPTSLGVHGTRDALPPSALTLAEALKADGSYQCVGISTNRNAGKNFGYDQGFDDFFPPQLERSYPDDHPLAIAEGVTTEALRWLEGRDPQIPFFMFLHYIDPHDPYLPHPGLLPDPEPNGRFDGSRRGLKKLRKTRRSSRAQLPQSDLARIKYLYEGEVKYCDMWIGRLLDGLEEMGLLENTLVVVTADHGEAFWEHGTRGHGKDLYEEVLHVPLLIGWPGMDEADSRRITDVVSLMDLAPTILAASGVPVPQQFQGRNLVPLLDGNEPESSHRSAYAELNYTGRNLEGIRMGAGKLIRNRARDASDEGAFELYNLSEDPEEAENLVGRTLEVETHLKQVLAKRRDSAELGARGENSTIEVPRLDPETLRALRAMGYI